MIVKRVWKAALAAGTVLAGGALLVLAQEGKVAVFKSKVDLVVLSFTVTDSRGHYITNLKPSDFKITEDGIAQKAFHVRGR